MRWRHLLPLLILGTGCGPEPEEIGGTALVGGPVYVLLSGLVVFGIAYAWHRIAEQRTIRAFPLRLPEVLLIVAHFALPVLVLSFGELMDSWGVGVAIVAASHAAFSLVLWRIFRTRPIYAASLASVICLSPAVPMVLGSSSDFAEIGVLVWLISGYMGAVPATFAAVLIIEAVIRQRRGGTRAPDPLASEFD